LGVLLQPPEATGTGKKKKKGKNPNEFKLNWCTKVRTAFRVQIDPA
jgi:hypothetical protein